VLQGHFNDIKDNPYISQLKTIYDLHKKEIEDAKVETPTIILTPEEDSSDDEVQNIDFSVKNQPLLNSTDVDI
jgi:hypothetical protein